MDLLVGACGNFLVVFKEGMRKRLLDWLVVRITDFVVVLTRIGISTMS